MIEPRRNWVIWAIAGLTLATMVGGLIVTGGPGQGRKERRDHVRLNDLAALFDQARCIGASEQRNDGDLSATAQCPDEPRLADPYTDEPYRIEPVEDRHLRLCAIFELPADGDRPRYGGPHGEWDGHCVVIQLKYD
ncbi:hypothetical protein [Paracoccus onubensis]|uniref:Uncharacterized protein n=1 Tax=Paracoccus onubensis TaxID=1675788 RepID=A0A418SN31_9RHOB|nr:hypothetical protein [Paracoccus onubensis]RJE82376.1 hypothetical protein D3P04_19765 [Paracoccus onubensis]